MPDETTSNPTPVDTTIPQAPEALIPTPPEAVIAPAPVEVPVAPVPTPEPIPAEPSTIKIDSFDLHNKSTYFIQSLSLFFVGNHFNLFNKILQRTKRLLFII